MRNRRFRFADAPMPLEGMQGSSPNTEMITGTGGRSDPRSGLWTTGQWLVDTLPAGNYFLITLPDGSVQLWCMGDRGGKPSLDLGQTYGTGDAAARLRAVSRATAARNGAIFRRINTVASQMWPRS